MPVIAQIRNLVMSVGYRIWHGLKEWVLDTIARIFHRGSSELQVISDSEGFKLTHYGRLRKAMQWSELTKVRFEQHDYTIEVVYFFFGDAHGNWINMYEFCEGLKEFQAEVDRRWPGYAEVAETYCQLALGRYDFMPFVTLDLVPGQRLHFPSDWLATIPPKFEYKPFWKFWLWFR